jgi:Protein of unknown function (DUF3667)
MKEIDNLDENNKLKRIDSSYIIHEIKHLLHLESGFLFTVKQLFIRPGKLVRNFILEDRSKATKPVIFLILSATIFTLTLHFFHREWHFFSLNQENIDQFSEKKAISDWMNNHIGYVSLMIGFLIALWIKVFFRKHGYNIYEITVLLCYSIGQLLLIIVFFSVPQLLFKIESKSEIGFYVGSIYIFWAIGQFFGEQKIMNYVKSMMCCLLGAVSFRLILNLLVTIYYQIGIK